MLVPDLTLSIDFIFLLQFLGKVYEDELAELEQQVLGDTRKASKEKVPLPIIY